MSESQDIGIKKFFFPDELHALFRIQSSILKEVFCYLWVNRISSPSLEFIVALELITDKGQVIISIHDSDESLEINTFNLTEIQNQLKKECHEKIRIFRIDASATKMWKDCILKPIQAIELTRKEENYLSDAMILNFGEELRMIQAHPQDGLIIDFYERD